MPRYKLGTEHKVIIASLAAGAMAWLIDALIDHMIFHEGQFLETLAGVATPHETYMRIITVVYFVIFGLIMAATLAARRRAEASRRTLEETYRSIFDTANDAIFVHDINTGEILDVNRKMSEMYGYTPEEARRVDVAALSSGVSPYSQKEALELIKRATEGEARLFEWLAKDKSGRLFWVEVNLKMAVIGGENRLLAIVRDISERKRVEESLRFTQFALDHAADPVEWVGYDARFVYVNEATCRALGYTHEELMNMTVWDIDPMISREDWEERWAALREQDSIRIESKHKRKNGHVFPVEITVNYFDFGGKEYICSFARDITERKEAEKTLRDNYEREKTIAQTLQESFLPHVDLTVEGFAIHEEYKSALREAEIGGDFYDVFNLEGGRIGLVIGDVSGKGLQAALHTAMTRHTLRAYAHEDPDPQRTLERLNKTLGDYMPEDIFVTLFYGVLDPSTNSLSYGSAGHEPSLLYVRESNNVVTLNAPGCPLGAGMKCNYASQTLEFGPGDVLLAYTDGITEARMNGQLFGIERLTKLLLENARSDERALADVTFRTARQFSGGELRDDAAILVVRRVNNE